MLRSLSVAPAFLPVLFLPIAAQAAVWPEHLGKFERKSVSEIPYDRSQPDEYGFQEAEQSDYGSFRVKSWRFRDSTGAYAASLEQPGKSILAGNYVITCAGSCPKDFAKLAENLPHASPAPLPILAGYLPAGDMLPHSTRYILGPATLARFAPGIPASTVAFQFSPEAAVAQYRSRKGDELLAIFSYPTPQIAREQAASMEKAGIGPVKRTGSFVAVVPAPPDPALAAKLLSEINYQVNVSWNEPIPIPIKAQSIAQMILAIFSLAGIVLAFCVLSGLGFAGFRILSKKFGHSNANQPMIVLDLRDK